MRSFDQRHHSYQGYVLRINGTCEDESGEFQIAVGKAAHEKHQFSASMEVDGIQQKVRAAYDAWVKEVLLLADNLKEAEGLPSYVLDGIKLMPVSSIEEVIAMSLVNNTSGGMQNGLR